MGPVQVRGTPPELQEPGLLNKGSGSNFVGFPRESNKLQSSLNFLESGPKILSKS